MIDIRLGQLYSFHKDPKEPIIAFVGAPSREELIQKCNIVMEVTEIRGYIGATIVKDKTGWFTIGTQYIAKQSDIEFSGNYRLIWDPSMEISTEPEYGADCIKCKKNYQYAIKVADFKCWSCSNGF